LDFLAHLRAPAAAARRPNGAGTVDILDYLPPHKEPSMSAHGTILATEVIKVLGLDPRRVKSVDMHVSRRGVEFTVDFILDRATRESLIRVFRAMTFEEERASEATDPIIVVVPDSALEVASEKNNPV
jgi:hypothetical protein